MKRNVPAGLENSSSSDIHSRSWGGDPAKKNKFTTSVHETTAPQKRIKKNKFEFENENPSLNNKN
jgi:hypothetical protein